MRNIVGIQYLRGLAAVMVVLIHADRTMEFPNYYNNSIFNSDAPAGLAVQMFFCISGFIMAVVCLDADGAPKLTLREFLLRRFIRIVPFLWFCTIAYNLFTLAGTGQIDWLPMLRALSLWPEGDFKPSVLWTLRLELAFYIVIAVCLLGKKKRLLFLAMWCTLPLTIRIVGMFRPSLLSTGDYDDLMWVYVMGHQAGANLQFGAGILVGLVWLRSSAGKYGGAATTLTSLVLYAGVASYLLTFMEGADPRGLYSIVLSSFLAALGLLLALSIRPSSGWFARLGSLLGDASYAIYLTHFIPLFTFFEIIKRLGLPGPQWMYLAIALAFAVIFGCVVHLLAERPIISGSRYLIERRWKSRALVPTGKAVHAAE